MRIAKRSLVISLSGLAIVSMLAAAFVVFSARGARASAITGQVVQLLPGGAASLVSGPTATDTGGGTLSDEIDAALNGDTDSSDSSDDFAGVNRSLPGVESGNGRPVNPGAQSKSNPVLGTNFEGLNLHDQRFANGGNQFSVEPPDQGLCAGNGFVLESVNDVLRIYHSDGTAATGVIDLNTFYNYPPAIVRSGPNAGQRGPSLTDPVCLYDQAIGRFVQVVLTLDHVGLTAAQSGTNHLDIAVSDTGDPTGGWTIFKLPVQNNGTQGTPDHHCNRGFCLGDYPHIGADANGIYLTTNEFAFFGPSFFYGSQIYGIGNGVLIGGTGSAVLFDTLGLGPDGFGFTVWAAQSSADQFDADNGGTEFLLSSDARFAASGTSTQLLQWTITNTSSLNTATPSPTLDVATIPVDLYAVPPRAKQPAGDRPLSQCIADTVVFPTCFKDPRFANLGIQNNATFGPPNGSLNSNDSRMQQVTYANGQLWGALDTAVSLGGQQRAGIAYYIINPNAHSVSLQGQAGVAGTDLTYPAIGVTPSGRAAIAFTLTGDSNYPSAAFAGLDAKAGLGAIHIAAAGAGPWDGFTSYVAYGAGRPRWGDYGAAAVVGNSIWIASEYVAQTCTYAAYIVDPTCGGTRAPLGNWSTHISLVTP